MRMLAAIGCLGAFAAVQAADPAALYDQAMQRYHDGEYARAYAGLKAAADAGHARAQEIAGLMALFGPQLYGPGVPHDPDTALATLRRAAQSGSEVARHVACAYAKRNGEAGERFCAGR